MEREPSWHSKLVNFLTLQGAHQDELDTIGNIKQWEDLSRFGFHLVSGLVSRDNKSEWTDNCVMQYLSGVFHPNNRRGSTLAYERVWPILLEHYPTAAEESKDYCLGYCDVDNFPRVSELINALPSQILRSFHYRQDIDSLDRKFTSDVAINSISEWWKSRNAGDDDVCRDLADSIFCHWEKWGSYHALISLLEQGAYACELATPGLILEEFADCISQMRYSLRDLEGLKCLALTGIDYRDLCSGEYTWTTAESALKEASRRRTISKAAIDEAIPLLPVANLVIAYLFTKLEPISK